MNFFKSVFSDEPDPDSPADPGPSSSADAAPRQPASTAAWDFGGLLKTISEKSESVIDTYRRDLQEFGTGLRKEIEAVHGSLDGVGYVFDDLGSSVLKGTAQIISQGKDAIREIDVLVKSDLSDHPSPASNNSYKVYSRFEAQLRALQGDAGTFWGEPENTEEYATWKSGFDLGAKRVEIENLVETNEEMMDIYERLVPRQIDDGTFWLRYFYRVHKLEQAESLRANLVKRAISTKEEELSWDVYDDDEEEKDGKVVNLGDRGEDSFGVAKVEGSLRKAADLPPGVDAGGEVVAVDPEKKPKEDVSSSSGCEHTVVKPVKEVEGKVNTEPDAENSEQGTCQNANSSDRSDRDIDPEALPGQPVAPEEEDLGWDEIEDLSSIYDGNDATKASQGGNPSPHREELRKRLNAADEEEDLSWDIEDDDEPAKP